MAQLQSWERSVALVKQVDWDTADDPDVTIPISSGANHSARIEELFDDDVRGQNAVVFDAAQGVGHGEVSIEGTYYPVEIGHILMAIFGADTISGAGDPYTHTFKGAASPPAYTLEFAHKDGTNLGARYAGAHCGSLSFSFDAAQGLLTYASQWMSRIPTVVTPQTPTPTASGVLAGWKFALTSTNLTGRLISGEINITRELEVRPIGGSQDPGAINIAALDATVTLRLIAEDLGDLSRYLTGLRQSVVLAATQGTPARGISFTLTDCDLNVEPVEYDFGNIGQVLTIQGRGIYNSTDAGPIQVALQNSRSTAY